MPVKQSEVEAVVGTRLLSLAAHQAKYGLTPGCPAMNVLRVGGNVADGETVVINGVTFEVDIINTDTGINTSGGEWNNTTDAVVVTMAAHGKVAGDLLRVETEYFKVLRVIDANTLVLARGRCGTTPATHADALDIFESNAAPAANVPVGLDVTLTPAAFTDALVDEINNPLTTGNKERATAKASTLYGDIVAVGPSDFEVLIKSISNSAITFACSETLAGATNLWSAAAMFGGLVDAHRKVAVFPPRVPTASEVALGNLYFPCDFTPRTVSRLVLVTATGAQKAWDGDVVLAANLVTLNNDGVTDWAATDTVYLVAYE